MWGIKRYATLALLYLVVSTPCWAFPQLLSVANDGVVAAVDEAKVLIWRSAGNAPTLKIDVGISVTAVRLTTTGKLLAIGNEMGEVLIYDAVTGDRNAIFKTDTAKILRINFFNSDRRIAVLSSLGTVDAWDIITDKKVWTVRLPHGGEIGSLALSSDSQIFAATVNNGGKLIDAATGSQLGRLHASPVGFVQQNASLLSVTEAVGGLFWHGLRLRSVPNGRNQGLVPTPVIPGAAGLKNAAAFHGDRQILATGYGTSRKAAIFSIAEGATMKPVVLNDFLPYTRTAEFSPDGRDLVATKPGYIRVWNVETGKRMRDISY